MVRPQTKVEQVISALLPLCLVWLFAACVSICGLRCADSDEQSLVSTVGEFDVDKSNHCDECPINTIPFTISQDRINRVVQSDSTVDLIGLVSTRRYSLNRTAQVARPCPLLADPPQKNLPALRI